MTVRNNDRKPLFQSLAKANFLIVKNGKMGVTWCSITQKVEHIGSYPFRGVFRHSMAITYPKGSLEHSGNDGKPMLQSLAKTNFLIVKNGEMGVTWGSITQKVEPIGSYPFRGVFRHSMAITYPKGGLEHSGNDGKPMLRKWAKIGHFQPLVSLDQH